ncbi:ABC transporter ATP-binding protein [Kyrpidia sp.]|uniref:ABC transporter ATP-binding protein n=1 Tax=Kyrpidia sp. TaxID=2073077 RepID=UPI002587CC73|nr:ABC transporter ATP-binding protein [Kyrpidia sp.]MCL6575450.1 ABC transporter ATP-binding protein [Kyrpidia sp.]
MLTIEGINKSFKSLRVLRDVSLKVQPGERHVIIGPNGAGKTTLFNCITGSQRIDAGRIYLGGEEITHFPSHRRVHLGLARTFQKNNLFGTLTVEQNIHLAVAATKPYRSRLFKPLSRYRDLREETEELLRRWKLTDRRNVRVNNLSYGEQRLLELVLALASRPRILLLDEPTSGMSPAETLETVALIQNLPGTMALLVIEHDMEVVFSIADRLTVLHHGEMIASGTPEEIRSNEMVKRIYFGGGAKIGAGA